MASGTKTREGIFAGSDGSEIMIVPQNQRPDNNGIILRQRYTAASDGVYTLSMTPNDGTWQFYAFSNEPIPEPALLGLIILGALALFRKK